MSILANAQRKELLFSAAGVGVSEGAVEVVRDIVLQRGFTPLVWDTALSGLDDSVSTYPVWTGSAFIVFGNNSYKRWRSTNGVDWTRLTSAVGSFYYPAVTVVSSSCLVAHTTTAPFASYSIDDGITWTPATGASVNRLSVAAGNGNIVVISTSSTAFDYSSDGGMTYTSGILPVATTAQSFIMWAGNMFVIFGYGMTSTSWSYSGAPGSWNTLSGVSFLSNGGYRLTNSNIIMLPRYSGGYDVLDATSGTPVWSISSKTTGIGQVGASYLLPNGVEAIFGQAPNLVKLSLSDGTTAQIYTSYPHNQNICFNDNMMVAVVGDSIYTIPLPTVIPTLVSTS